MSGQFYVIPVRDTISSAWEKVSGSKGSFWASIGILFLIMFGIGILQGLTEHVVFISVIFSILSNIIGYFCQLGLIYMGIKRAKDEPINFKMMFSTFDLQLGLNIVGLYILQILIFIIPIAVCGIAGYLLTMDGNPPAAALGAVIMIPGVLAIIFLAIRLSLSMAYVLDTSAGPVAALKLSMKATEGNFWKLLGIFALQMVIIAIGLIPAGLGLIWTLPFAFICYGLVYQRLRVNAANI